MRKKPGMIGDDVGGVVSGSRVDIQKRNFEYV
jgi:hypothetical protein